MLIATVSKGQDSVLSGSYFGKAHRTQLDDKTAKKRQWLIGSTTTAIYATMFVGLNESWYKDYPRSSFHTFNDAGEWQQMDKIGHAWTVYTAANLSYGMYRWAGMKNDKATLISSGSGLAYMLAIEYLDGRSTEWGWSWADVGGDVFGAALFASQQLAWKEQKVQLKFSSHEIQYPSDLRGRANELYGSKLSTRILKDYNAQTYWLSYRLPLSDRFPKWLQLSFGYGAKGMYGGYENIALDKGGNMTFDRRDIKRVRQWYLAPDIDLTKIKTKSKLLRTVFYTFNSLKFPAPTLEFSDGKLKGHWLYF
ncbi:MAG: hypothetical protein JWP88_1740 [Flaviaesturariibacter sp.]|nr:hypothetical protein [Flaviaesturariibacter sp.]